MNRVAAIMTIICAAVVTVAAFVGAQAYGWELAVAWWVAALYAARLWRATK